ncbi:hypothetical protein HAX54_042337 [Datura stramonium]|uniref:Uncharacterized protein n=1 Tax=Datura stramonium TaxID=4076 RepID=A0ABS8SM42_DATST|nr:hypothetical protein [Datura stramonium]
MGGICIARIGTKTRTIREQINGYANDPNYLGNDLAIHGHQNFLHNIPLIRTGIDDMFNLYGYNNVQTGGQDIEQKLEEREKEVIVLDTTRDFNRKERSTIGKISNRFAEENGKKWFTAERVKNEGPIHRVMIKASAITKSNETSSW